MANLLNVSQAAQVLGCSKHFLYRKAETGQVPVYRLGKALRFDPDELRAWARCALRAVEKVLRAPQRLRGLTHVEKICHSVPLNLPVIPINPVVR